MSSSSTGRPFHHLLPAIPPMPEERDPGAPVHTPDLERLLTQCLQDLEVPADVVSPRDRVFLEAWIRAFVHDYAPGAETTRIAGEGEQLLVTLRDAGEEKHLSLRPGRSEVGGEDQYLEIAPCDAVLLICPVWTTLYPPQGLAYLTAALEQAGFGAEPVDLNVWLHRALHRIGRHDMTFMWRSQVNFTLFADEADWADELMGLLGHKVDQLVRNIVRSGARLVGISVHQSGVEMALRVARRVKAADPGITVVLGGPAATATVRFRHRYGPPPAPGQPLAPHSPWRAIMEYSRRLLESEEVDHLVAGEGELTVVALMRALQRGEDPGGVPGVATLTDGGRGLRFVQEQVPEDPDSVPWPSWRRLEPHRYGRPDTLPFWLSRGCINRCAYCTNNAYLKPGYRCRDARRALDEMQHLVETYGVSTFAFTDLCCNGDLEGLEAFLDLKLAEGPDATWHSYVVMRPDMPQRIVEKIVSSGNIRFEYGFESGSDHVLGLMGKTYTAADAERLLRWSTEAGGHPCINLVVGFPHETEQDLEETICFLQRNAPWIGQVASMNPFTMLPHARVLDQAADLGIYVGHLTCDWRLEDGTNDVVQRDQRVRRLGAAIDEFGIRHGSPYDLTITEESPEQSVARRNLQSGIFLPPRGAVRQGPLRAVFEDGRLELHYRGRPLTTGLHLYTAVMFDEGPFVDSLRTRWAVDSDGRRLRAAGTWPNDLIAQLWWVNAISERVFRVVIETQVRETTLLRRRQTHLMLDPRYDRWCAGALSGTFPAKTPAAGEPWNRFFFEPGVMPVEVSASGGGLPGLRVRSEMVRRDARTGLIVAGAELGGHVVQHLVLDDERVDPVTFYHYKGTFEVLP